MSSTSLDRWTEARETLVELIEWLDDARQWAESAVPAQEPVDEEARQAAQVFAASELPELPAADRPPLDLHDTIKTTRLRFGLVYRSIPIQSGVEPPHSKTRRITCSHNFPQPNLGHHSSIVPPAERPGKPARSAAAVAPTCDCSNASNTPVQPN
jgi:hypothetical protein